MAGRMLWIVALCVATAQLGLMATGCIATPPIREFDAWIAAVNAAQGTVTIHHNATQYSVTLRTDGNPVYQRVRQAPFTEFPSGQSMRFWGALDTAVSSITIQGIRRATSDDIQQ